MAVTAVGFVHGADAAAVVALMTAQIASEAATVPMGAPVPAIPSGFDWYFRVGGETAGTLEDLTQRVDALEADMTQAQVDITDNATAVGTAQTAADDAQAYAENINAWGIELATKLNADATQNNALSDWPLTLDTDYATDPQA